MDNISIREAEERHKKAALIILGYPGNFQTIEEARNAPVLAWLSKN
jgi:hypothetical protein